jgi:mono/diheme cytochrome c family protein
MCARRNDCAFRSTLEAPVARILKVVGWIVLAVLVVIATTAFIVYRVALSRYHRHWTTHISAFPIPFPLTADEVAALRAERAALVPRGADPLAGVDLNEIALDRAIARGEHIVNTRGSCPVCHGPDLGGGVIVDSPMVGRWVAPNLTSGTGGVTADFTAVDWDRAIRHGIRHNGETSSMPSTDFSGLSDHELSDIAAYVRSRPPVNRTLSPSTLGPVFIYGITFENSLSAFHIDHQKPHAVEPPAERPDAALGEHLAEICHGCHGPTLSGGKMSDPTMPFVANLTPDATGLKDWTQADFFRALRTGVRKNGTPIDSHMPWRAYGQMSDTELAAIWTYLRTVPAVPKGNH